MLGTLYIDSGINEVLTSVGILSRRLRLRLVRLWCVDEVVAVDRVKTESRRGLTSAVEGTLVDGAKDETLGAYSRFWRPAIACQCSVRREKH